MHGVSFRLYREPRNIYQYLSRCSCRPESVFTAHIFCEATWVLRRCSSVDVVQSEWRFFASKLVAKGYHMAEIASAFKLAHKAFSFSIKFFEPTRSNKTRKAFLKINHCSSVNYSFLQGVVRKRSTLHESRVITCSRIHHSIFVGSTRRCGATAPSSRWEGIRELDVRNMLLCLFFGTCFV